MIISRLAAHFNRRKVADNFICVKPVSLSVSKNAEVRVDGSIDFNVSQTPGMKNKSCGYVVLGDSSKLNCTGNFVFSGGCRLGVMNGAELTLGSGYMNYDSKIYCFNKITIGSNVAISENVIIRDSDNHRLSGQTAVSAPIVIGDNVWIGMNVTILKGVTIGEGCVIAAGAVVTKDIPPNTLAAGVPAKPIRSDISWKL